MENNHDYFKINFSRKSKYLENYTRTNDEQVTEENIYFLIYNDLEIVFDLLNLSPRKFGYKYWKDAIYLYITSVELQVSICKEIYPVIAKKYAKSSNSIERAMRLCFEDALYFCSKAKNNYVTNYLKNVLIYPHNSEIMVKIAELITSKDFQNTKINLISRFNA